MKCSFVGCLQGAEHKFGSNSEKLNPGWIDMANTIDSWMLTIPVVREALLEADDLPVRTNPVEGIPMLQLVFFVPLIHRRP